MFLVFWFWFIISSPFFCRSNSAGGGGSRSGWSEEEEYELQRLHQELKDIQDPGEETKNPTITIHLSLSFSFSFSCQQGMPLHFQSFWPPCLIRILYLEKCFLSAIMQLPFCTGCAISLPLFLSSRLTPPCSWGKWQRSACGRKTLSLKISLKFELN